MSEIKEKTKKQRSKTELARTFEKGQNTWQSASALGGISTAAVLLSLFADVADAVKKDRLDDLDKNVEKLFGKPDNPVLKTYFQTFSVAGKQVSTFTLAVVSAGLMFRQKKFLPASLILLSVFGGGLLNIAFKKTLNRPRPLSLERLTGKKKTGSFPSGHTTVAVCYYGMLAWLGTKFFKNPSSRLGWSLLMVYLILMISLSRVYLRDHHASDVIGSYLLGSFWLAVLVCGANLYPGSEENK